jgi:hypothetical protein
MFAKIACYRHQPTHLGQYENRSRAKKIEEGLVQARNYQFVGQYDQEWGRKWK